MIFHVDLMKRYGISPASGNIYTVPKPYLRKQVIQVARKSCY